jgi:hypothetical protein
MGVSRWVVSLASQNSVGGTKHNNHNSKYISRYETNVAEYIKTICAYGSSAKTTRCLGNYPAPLCSLLPSLGRGNHNSGDNDSISEHEAKIEGHIGMI